MKTFFKSLAFKRALILTLAFFLAFAALGAFIGLWYGTTSAPTFVEEAPACCNLKIGEDVTINQIVSEIGYKPFWILNEDIKITVKAYDADGKLSEEDCEGVLFYDEKTKKLMAKGIGSGTVAIKSPIDRSVILEVPFSVGYRSADVENIVKTQYKKLIEDAKLTSDEISQISEVTVTGETADVADLAYFTNVDTIHLACDDGIPAVSNMLKAGSWDYFVPQAYYNMVITDGKWSQYQNYIFPESGKTDDQISLVFDPRGGSFKNGTSTFDSDCRKKNVYVLEEKTGETVNVSFYTPEKKGFTFNGWVVDGNGKEVGQPYMTSGYKAVCNAKAHADWTEHKYTVKFNANGGTGSISNRTLRFTESFTPNSSYLTREGFDFIGWGLSPNGEIKVLPNTPFAELTPLEGGTVELFAIWRMDVYNVEFWDGSTKLHELKNVGYFENVTMFDYKPASKVGETYLGWSTQSSASTSQYANKQNVNKLSSNYGETVRLYAIWDANKYSIRYDANGGTNAPADTVLRYGTAGFVTSAVPTKHGASFVGWSTSKTAKRAEVQPHDSVINLTNKNGGVVIYYAVWEPDTFSIVFNNTGADSGKTTTKTLEYGSAYSCNFVFPTKVGYGIAGWSKTSNAGTASYDVDHFSKSDINSLYDTAIQSGSKTVNLYPVWKELIYSVEYDTNGGYTSANDATYDYYTSFTLPNATKDYYKLDYWRCDFDNDVYLPGETFSGADFTGIAMNETVTFEAEWELTHYDLKYNLNGGSGSVSNRTMVSVSESFNLAGKPTRSGYTFAGWESSVDDEIYDAGERVSNLAESEKKTVTLTALWEPVPAAQ